MLNLISRILNALKGKPEEPQKPLVYSNLNCPSEYKPFPKRDD